MPRFPRSAKLTTSAEFDAVRRQGCTVRSAALKVSARAACERRLGLTASRAVGNAVQRNRLKRIAREHFRLHRSRYPKADCVVLFSAAATQLSPTAVRAELDHLLEKLSARFSSDERAPS